ncbi:MAG: ribulose-phosphate 3-epimerase [Erysipelotrichaceae bacterium]|nr:ribulose-phosphate 3-epimerase [Erysipelotrichaceae bacterium]
MIIAPSVLSLDYSDTKKQMEALNASKAQWVHFDVMDGHFVPNLSFGVDVMKGLKKTTDKLMDVHLMVSDPRFFVPSFVKNGADLVTFHIEAMKDLEDAHKLIEEIHSLGVKAGISIKPKTSVEAIKALLPELDLVLVMSVEPGFGGQSFDETALAKISELRQIIDDQQLACLIEVDGGINDKTGALCKEAGVDVLVAGSYLFKQDIVAGVESLW